MSKILNVLLVDDDEDEFVLLREMFSSLPGQGNGIRYVLDWASTYQEALTACEQKPVDIYLVDYHLGKYNGLELIRALVDKGCKTPSILLTGQGSYELDLAAMQQGVYDYLLKDQVNAALLERTIRYALERRQAEDELERRVRQRTKELASANDELRDEISRRTQVEETLRESESRFRVLAETTSAAIFIVQDGIIQYTNPAARFVTGFLPDELLGMPLAQLAHPTYQAVLQESRLGQPWSENIPSRYEIKIVTKLGDERWVDLTAGQMPYLGQPALVITAFDITERDLAEKELRKARDELEMRVALRTQEIQATSQRLQTVLSTLPVGILIVNRAGKLVEINQATLDLWESPNSLDYEVSGGDHFQVLRSETGEALPWNELPLWSALAAGHSTLNLMLDIITRSGQRKTILCSSVPIFGPQGEPTGGVAVFQDITTQRHLEQQAQAAAHEAQQRAEELEGLHRATAALLSTLDLDELLCQILDAAQSAIPAAEKGMLHLVSPSTGQLQVRATLGFSDKRIQMMQPSKVNSYQAWVANERKPVLISDILKGPQINGMAGLTAEMGEVRSLVLAPLRMGEQVLGTLSLSAARPNAFTQSNLRLLASFAATTTAALQNAILHAEIKQLAVTDPLTGQYNRRAFFELGQRELERFLRFNHPLSAVMIDLDHFKEINDTYGHAVGDQILRVLAERCRGSIRETDIFGRYGGDEFSLLLPDTDLFVAKHIAGRILDAITGTPWPTEQGLVNVSASLGVASAYKHHRRLEDLLGDADQALYQAKAAGRNGVYSFQ
jgi:diguanylate cyclase (GGDEF)-like protein/PAS domain S-box-containing protein